MTSIAKILCGALFGVDAFKVDLEVDLTKAGIPAFTMVGLAEGAVRESRDRVLAALKSSSYRIPPSRITVNLAPADRKKGGSSYDLPLAVGLMEAAGILPNHCTNGFMFAGELSLTGELRPVTGILPLAILARDLGAKGFLVAPENATEAAIVEGLPVYPVQTLGQVVEFLTQQTPIKAAVSTPYVSDEYLPDAFLADFADVKGQEHAKRAIEIAAAGGHNLLFVGPPGSGKTMLAQRMPSILPSLQFEEALEVTKIYSVAGLLEAGHGLVQERPFRAPHHTISEYGLVGGGLYPRPGEISLAHKGVLFLDELLEFRKQTLEVLRQPLENGVITIARSTMSLTYPANTMLVAALNPCPCGYATDHKRTCSCSDAEIKRYRARLSGPLLDRIDLHIEVPAVAYNDLQLPAKGKTSQKMRETVEETRKVQHERYKDLPMSCNAELSGKALDTYCALDDTAHAFLKQAVQSLHLSARAYTRILRISRTIADIEKSPHIAVTHLAEAVNCRILDRSDW